MQQHGLAVRCDGGRTLHVRARAEPHDLTVVEALHEYIADTAAAPGAEHDGVIVRHPDRHPVFLVSEGEPRQWGVLLGKIHEKDVAAAALGDNREAVTSV